MKTNAAIAVLVLLGLFGHIQAFRTHDAKFICGTDFPVFWADGKLLGTAEFYSAAAVQKIQKEAVGCTASAAANSRLPFFAVFIWPFTLLPVGMAFWLYRGVLLIAELGFIVSCGRHWKWALLACVWSFPLAYDLDNGQDVSFLLLEVAAAGMLLARGRSFAAGMCLALGAAKFHLMLFVPLTLLWRHRRAFAGMIAGGMLLLAISFAAAGWDWPLRYRAAISTPRIDPDPLAVHNLRGLTADHLPVELALSLTVAAAVWFICRRSGFAVALAAALCGGVIVSHHQTPCDWALLLPAGMILGLQTEMRYVRYIAILLISPAMVWLGGISGLSHVPDLLLLCLVYALAWHVWRKGEPNSATKMAAVGAAF